MMITLFFLSNIWFGRVKGKSQGDVSFMHSKHIPTDFKNAAYINIYPIISRIRRKAKTLLIILFNSIEHMFWARKRNVRRRFFYATKTCYFVLVFAM